MARQKAIEIEVEVIGQVERIVYTRDGERYEHVFDEPPQLATTAYSGRELMVFGPSVRVDQQGYIYG